MFAYTVKRIDEMRGTFQGAFKLARAELGVSAFGMQILDLPPNLQEGYPEHDHAGDGQEEIYVVLHGSGRMRVEGEEIDLTPEVIVRVAADVKRHITTGPDGARILCV